jgi:hypothetical protein
MSREAASAPSPAPRTSTLSSERARELARKSWAGTTPAQRHRRTLPARLAAAKQALAQLDAQARGAS